MTAGEHVSAAPEPTVVALSGELDAADVSWAEELSAALDAGATRIVLDLRDVSFIDSSVIREVLRAQRAVGPDGWVRLVYTHNVIHRIVEVCGLSDLFPQYLTPAAATRGNARHHQTQAVSDEEVSS